MGFFFDDDDDEDSLLGDIFRPYLEFSRDVFDTTRDLTLALATPAMTVSAPVIAAALGITVGVVQAAITAGCSTVGEVRDWALKHR